MNSASRLLKNTLLLAGSTVTLRLFALCFQSYLAAQIGAEKLGLFGIISSVGVVFATIAISGVRFSVTRLVAEEESRGNLHPRSLMRCAYCYALAFGVLSGLAMYFFADALSVHWVTDSSAAFPLRLMALSMPLISLGGAAEGYFTAKQKIFRLIFVELTAQLGRIAFVAVNFSMFSAAFPPAEVLAAGSLISEGILGVGLLFLYFADNHGKKENHPGRKNLGNLVKTAFPLAVSAYMRTGLSSLGQIIIPRGLRRSGMGSASAFATYGVIAQMSMPVVMFPAALLNALGEILVPRLTAAQVTGKKIGISYIVNRALRIGIIFSFGVAGVMFFCSQLLGQSIYGSVEAGMYIRIFAPLVPIIYVDCVTDGCLKGLNQQVYSMVYNVLEGVINVVLLLVLLPETAIMGYIAVMYIKEVFNAVLSLRRLSKVTLVDINILTVISVVISVCGAGFFCKIAFPGAPLPGLIAAYSFFYGALLYILSAVTRDDLKWVVSLLKFEGKQKYRKKTAVRC